MQLFSRFSAIFVIASTVSFSGIVGSILHKVNAVEQFADRGLREHYPSVGESANATETENVTMTAPMTHYPELSFKRDAGNPLWSLSLATLAATRNAPLFSPSRRPPAVVLEPKVSEVSTAPAAISAPPTVSLVGAISGNAENIAIFFDRTSKDVFRLKPGESYFGWTLKTVKPRQATLQKNNDKMTVEFSDPPAK
jgi:hypothetical protein